MDIEDYGGVMLGRNKKTLSLFMTLEIIGWLAGSQLVDSLLSTNRGWITLPLEGIISYGIVLILIVVLAPLAVPPKSLKTSTLNLRGVALITSASFFVGVVISLIDLNLSRWLGDGSPVRMFLVSLTTALAVFGIPVLVFKEWPWSSEKHSHDPR
jgi:hypothetical protein